MAYTDITGLGRELNPRLPSHRIVLVGGVAAFAGLSLAGWLRDDFSVFGAAFGAVAVFLGWAVSRELEPDRPDASYVAMALTFGIALVDAPSALAAGVALIAIRLVAGTVGAALQPLDLLVFAGTVGLATATPILWTAAAALGIWAWMAPEAEPNRRWVRIAFGLGAVGGLGFAAWQTWFGSGFETEITMEAYVAAAAAGGAMIFSVRHLPITSMTDEGGAVISPERIRLARIVTGAVVMWAAVFGGIGGFWALGPVFAALAVAAVYRVFVHAM